VALAKVFSIRSQSIYFVEKEDRRCVIPSQLKQLMQVFFAVTDLEIQDLMYANGDEVRFYFAGRRFANQSLAASRRSIEQNTAT
jgi:hypothetical protein